jgi:putative hydrolase of the HAD superfamily
MGERFRAKAVIFDYAGVLSLEQPRQSVQRMEGVSGIYGRRFQELYWGFREPYDRGEFDGACYWRMVGEAQGLTFSEEQIRKLVAEDTLSWSHTNEPMLGWVQVLKFLGIKVGLLSNLGAELRDHLRDRCEWIAGFDHSTFSCEVGLVKPDGGIYRHCLKGLDAEPRETLFVDDREENVRAAAELGMRGVLFRGVEDLASEIAGGVDLPVPLVADESPTRTKRGQ